MKKIIYTPEIYTYNIDFAGHVSNIAYIQWMEIGRLKLLEEIGLSVHEIAKIGITPVLVSTEIKYRKPLYLGDKVTAEVWISELSHATAFMKFRFYKNKSEIAAEGIQKGLFININSQKPHRLTPEQRKLFLAFVEDKNEDR